MDREVGIAAPLPSRESEETFVPPHGVGVVGGLKNYWLLRHFMVPPPRWVVVYLVKCDLAAAKV